MYGGCLNGSAKRKNCEVMSSYKSMGDPSGQGGWWWCHMGVNCAMQHVESEDWRGDSEALLDGWLRFPEGAGLGTESATATWRWLATVSQESHTMNKFLRCCCSPWVSDRPGLLTFHAVRSRRHVTRASREPKRRWNLGHGDVPARSTVEDGLGQLQPGDGQGGLRAAQNYIVLSN